MPENIKYQEAYMIKLSVLYFIVLIVEDVCLKNNISEVSITVTYNSI